MRTKSFRKYVEKRLSKEQIEEIEQKAAREIEKLRAEQNESLVTSSFIKSDTRDERDL